MMIDKPLQILNLETEYGILINEVGTDEAVDWNKSNLYELNENKEVSVLNLIGNDIKHISKVFNDLPSLTKLLFSQNKIQKIENLNTLTKLQTLDLSINEIEKIENINHLTLLTILYLDQNRIKKIENIDKLSNLHYLWLNSNKITKIENLNGQTGLSTLNLHNNEVKKIESLHELIELSTLNLNNNKIEKIENLSGLAKLEYLHLTNNKIQKIESIDFPSQIKRIDLSNNLIIEIDPFLNKVFDLKWMIESKYEGVNLYGNPLDSILVEIIKSNNKNEQQKQLVAYFERQLKKGVKNIKKVKLIFLGNTEAGKTTLADILSKEKKANKGSTHGVNFFNFSIENIQVKGFDFGGQDYYHNTHYTFFDENALYILVWGNGQKNEMAINAKGEMLFPLNYWLGSLNKYKNIQTVTVNSPKKNLLQGKESTDNNTDQTLQTVSGSENYKDSPTNKLIFKQEKFILDIYLLQNTIKDGQKEWLNEEELKKRYSYIKDFQTFSLKQTKDIRMIKSWLSKLVQSFAKETQMNQLDYEISNSFLNKTNQDKVILSYKDIRALNEELKNYKDQEITDLLKLLHKVLACYYLELDDEIKLFFDESKIIEIESKVIVNIEKFTNWIYTVLNQEDLLIKKNGYFSNEDILEWLKNDNKAKSNVDYIIAFMLQQKLVFKMQGVNNCYFAPNYLKITQSRTEELFLKTFEPPLVKYQFTEYFHTSLLSDIISEFYNHLIIEQETKYWEYVLWKNKVILFEGLDDKTEKLIYIQFDFETGFNPTISISRYNKNVSDDFVLRVMDFIEKKIKPYSNKKIVITPRGNYIPYDKLSEQLVNEDQENSNVFVHEKLIYRRADFKLFLNNKTDYPMKKIFISYSKYDEDYKEEFKKHTRTLQEEGLIDKPFDCGAIDLGAEWDATIQNALNECDIVVCLVSVDFLNTDYIRKYEVKKAIDTGKILIPIIIKSCDWENSDFGKFQAGLRAKKIALDSVAELKGIVKENSDVEKAAYWTKVIKEMRIKLFNKNP